MSLIGKIAGAYARPKTAIKSQIARSSEERILFYAMLFSFLSFIARVPELLLLAQPGEGSNVLSARIAAMFVSSVLMAPLMLYLVAALSHLVLRAFGGKAGWQQARMALMWSVLVALPLVLISGAVKVLLPGAAFSVASLVTGVVFLWQWSVCLRVVEFTGTGQADDEKSKV